MRKWLSHIGSFNKRPRKKKILFISQPLFKDSNEVDTFDYFCQLFASLCIHLDSLVEFDFITKVPSSFSTAAEEQNKIIQYCIENPYEYQYLIVNLFSRIDSLKVIEDLIITPNAPKIILIDKGYREKDLVPNTVWDNELTKNKLFWQAFDDNDKRVPAYFQANWESGGEQAAESLLHYLENCKSNYDNIKSYRFLYLNGNDCFERGIAFESVIKRSSQPNLNIDVKSLNSDFTNEGAFKVIGHYLQEHKSLNSTNPIAGIFTSNDEMALGARRALINYEQENPLNLTPKIVGCDGIKDVTLLIDQSNEKYLINTINVKVDSMTKEVYNFLNQTIRSNKWVDKYVEKNCELYKSKHQQKY